MIECWNYCDDIIKARQQKPGDDYPSHLQSLHNADPEVITLGEIHNLTFGVLLARRETTTNAIGNTMHILMDNRTEWGRLVANPTLATAFVEEGLRAGPPMVIWRRQTAQPVTLSGKWNGSTYQIHVVDGGFELDGKGWKSLSVIAKHITGATWSGQRLFGLKAQARGRSSVGAVGESADLLDLLSRYLG